MPDPSCGLAGETKVETPEGPLTIKGLAGKRAPVFVLENGRVRFRMMENVRLLAAGQPVVRITLANGATFRVSPSQTLFKKGMTEVAAAELRPDDGLVPMFDYPEGYEYVDQESGATIPAAQALAVRTVEPAGTADLYSLQVPKTGCFFVAAGVLCRAE